MKKFDLVSYFKRSLSLFSPQDKKKYLIVGALQASLAFLDLIGVAIFAIVAALAIRGVQSQSPGTTVSKILEYLHLESFSFQSQVAILGTCATFFLVFKTIITMVTTRKILLFLGNKSAVISEQLTTKVLSLKLSAINTKSVSDIQYALGYGVNSIVLGILGVFITIFTDSALLIILAIGVLVIDPVIALFSLVLFSGIGTALYLILHKRARKVGENVSVYAIESNRILEEVIVSFREVYSRGRLQFYADKIGKIRSNYAQASAEQVFLPNISKYVLETSVILGAMAVSAMQFIFYDASHAAAGLALFVATGTRLAPALLRIQQSLISLQGNIGTSLQTFALIDLARDFEELPISDSKIDVKHSGFVPEVELTNVDFKFVGQEEFTIKNLNLRIMPGTVTAIVGGSGAGKTTLADIILGIHEPTNGTAHISGIRASEAVKKWPGAISYVPQDVTIFDSSINENILLGYDSTPVSLELTKQALAWGHFDEDFLDSRDFENGSLGPRGSNLSGGQRQRVGLARAMLTKPLMLILDEATSALDSKTESLITESLRNLKGKITLIVIAHRLSTIRDADTVVFLKNGQIEAAGTFTEVRTQIPDFDEQATLMGL